MRSAVPMALVAAFALGLIVGVVLILRRRPGSPD